MPKGPRETISPLCPAVIHFISSHSSVWDGRRFLKEGDSRGYDNLVDLRDSVLHTQLRKPWNKAFSIEAVKGYEELIVRRVIELNSLLKEVCTTSERGIGRVDMANWVNSFS